VRVERIPLSIDPLSIDTATEQETGGGHRTSWLGVTRWAGRWAVGHIKTRHRTDNL
jgi:hypothetical protein